MNKETPTSSNSKFYWTPAKDELLIQKVKEYNNKHWKAIASFFPGKTAIQCSAHYGRVRPGIVKGSWTKEEDEKLIRLYAIYGKNWSRIARKFQSRTGKQIRDRYVNCIDENRIKVNFTLEDDRKIKELYPIYGTNWNGMACFFKGKTGDMIKNRLISKFAKNGLNSKKEKNKIFFIEKVVQEKKFAILEENLITSESLNFLNINYEKGEDMSSLNSYILRANLRTITETDDDSVYLF